MEFDGNNGWTNCLPSNQVFLNRDEDKKNANEAKTNRKFGTKTNTAQLNLTELNLLLVTALPRGFGERDYKDR